MKHSTSLFLSLSVIAGMLAGCTPKDRPRKIHEERREWTVPDTPNDPSVRAQEFNSFDLNAAYAVVTDPSADLVGKVLTPLARFVLNKSYIENPVFRTSTMTQMIQIFNRAFLNRLEAGDQSAEFRALKDAYYATIFSGCSSDLRRDCVNDRIFSDDAYHTRIMTRLAQELDQELDPLMNQFATPGKCVDESARCRVLLEERYRRLAMGMRKRSRNYDGEFSFAYMKHARALAYLLEYDRRVEGQHPSDADDVSTSYLSEVHAKIFETLIAHYQPENIMAPEFKAFVENFNPWGYSQRRADIFQYGTRIMFEFGTQCCLYKDAERTQLADAVKQAIEESQKDSDSFGLSFQQMIADIETKVGTKIFDNLNMTDVYRMVKDPKSSYYNEYFLVVDRLFRGHLNSAEIEMVLRNTPSTRTQAELPKMIETYLKVYLIHMVVETNVFMASIYNSSVTSDKVFEEATTRSRELTARWHTIQSQIELLERVMGSYFKGQNLFSAEFNQTTRLIKAVNRNIHYLSVYPNMIVMVYFLSKMRGSIVVNTWWGRIEINADTILDAFLDGGMESPWFRFGKDPELLDRFMLLYAWEFMLSTDALNSFSAKEGTISDDERGMFYDLIFSKYLDDNINELRMQVNDYDRAFFGSPQFGTMQSLCNYELGQSNTRPAVQISFLDLDRYTYSGLGENNVNALLIKFGKEPGTAFKSMRTLIDSRVTYIKALVEILEFDLIRRGKIAKRGDSHRDTEKAYEMIGQLEQLKGQITKSFVQNHERYLDCALRLQEVERRRTNRLYEEERKHLGEIFDMLQPLYSMDEQARDQKIQEINDTYFRKEGSGYRFDSLSGLSYRMSQYDLLARMEKRIEADIFVTPTEAERRVYAGRDNSYYKPRRVTVFHPDGVERDTMVSEQTTNTISMTGDTPADREAFIKAGMASMNGKPRSFIQWQGQRTADVHMMTFLNTLIQAYLLGPVVVDGQTYQVTKEQLTEAYVKIMASFTIDELDVIASREFGNDGRFDRAFFQDKLFEGNGVRMAFFYYLMVQVKAAAGIKLENAEGTKHLEEALKYAQGQNNLRPFVFLPSDTVPDRVLKQIYGDRAHAEILRVGELYAHLKNLESNSRDAVQLDSRLNLPFYLQDGQPVVWYSPSNALVDQTRANDFKNLVDDFTRRTSNFYETREKVILE